MNLTDKVALITGGARRVGRQVALQLAEAGCHIALTFNRSAGDAEQSARDIEAMGRRAWIFQTDFARPDSVQPLARQILQETGRLDVLVHNASVFDRTPWAALTAAQWTTQMNINALSPVLLTQALHPALEADEGGRVIHFLDVHILGRPRRDYGAYSASKAALLEMTRTLALEMAPRVTVNAIAPGVIAWAEGMSETEKTAYLQRVPLGRPGTPDDAARAVLYLARDADYMTGQTLVLDGGRWLM